VAVLVAGWLVDRVVQVARVSGRLIVVGMVVGGTLVGVVSACAPRAALSEGERDTFWDGLRDVVAEVPPGEFVMLGGDLGGHVGGGGGGCGGLRGGFGFGRRSGGGGGWWWDS
jgi:hypothetical protein